MRYSQSFFEYQTWKKGRIFWLIGTFRIPACVFEAVTSNQRSERFIFSFLRSNSSDTRTPVYINMRITLIYSLASFHFHTVCISSVLNGVRLIALGFPAFFMSIYSTLFLSGGIISCMTAHLNIIPTNTLYFRKVGKFFPELSAMYCRSSNVTSTKRFRAISWHNK